MGEWGSVLGRGLGVHHMIICVEEFVYLVYVCSGIGMRFYNPLVLIQHLLGSTYQASPTALWSVAA